METSEIKVELSDDEDLKLITMINNQDVDGINTLLDGKRQGKLISDIVRLRSSESFLHRNGSSLMNFYFNRFPAINGQIYMNKEGKRFRMNEPDEYKRKTFWFFPLRAIYLKLSPSGQKQARYLMNNNDLKSAKVDGEYLRGYDAKYAKMFEELLQEEPNAKVALDAAELSGYFPIEENVRQMLVGKGKKKRSNRTYRTKKSRKTSLNYTSKRRSV
jgi:hypothetical protein